MQFAYQSMSTFYLVRHAHADWTPDESRPLSKRGRRDAQRLAQLLAAYPIGRIYASPYARARQTIVPLASRLALPISSEADLRERGLGDGYFDDFVWAVEKTWRDPAFAFPGGETNAAAQERGVAVVRQLLDRYPAEHIVLATHGNLLALILQAYDPSVDFGLWQSLTMPDVYRLDLGRDGRALIDRLWPGGVSWE